MTKRFLSKIAICGMAIMLGTANPVTESVMQDTGIVITAEAAAKKLNYKEVTLKVGKTKTLKVLNNTKTVKWSTSNKNVVTLLKSGRHIIVKGKKAGKATITAKVGDKKYKCYVTVERETTSGGNNYNTPGSGTNPGSTNSTLKLDRTDCTRYTNDLFAIHLSGTTSKEIKVSSDDESIATIKYWDKSSIKEGKPIAFEVRTFEKAGTTTLRFKVDGQTLTCKLTVKKPEIPKASDIHYKTTDFPANKVKSYKLKDADGDPYIEAKEIEGVNYILRSETAGRSQSTKEKSNMTGVIDVYPTWDVFPQSAAWIEIGTPNWIEYVRENGWGGYLDINDSDKYPYHAGILIKPELVTWEISNPDVCSVEYAVGSNANSADDGYGSCFLEVNAKKVGTTTIKFKYRGLEWTRKVIINEAKYDNTPYE